MTRTVIAMYDDLSHASAAVRDLVDNGFTRDDVSLMASDVSGEYGAYFSKEGIDYTETSGAAEGAGVGAGIGAVVGGLGGLLIGLGALTIPGIGPVLAAGPLAVALTGLAGAGAGAVAGGVTGGLLGALIDMGVPEENAQYYAEGVRRGSHLVSVRTPDHMSDQAVDILNSHDPIDLNERVSEWRAGGWTGSTTGVGAIEDDIVEGDIVDEGSAYRKSDLTPDYRESEWERASQATTDLTTDYGDYDAYEDRFQNHFDSSAFAGTNTFEQYRPAYRYGYELATDDQFRERDWMDIESEAHQRWEERNPGTWEEFKTTVRHAWEEIKDAVD